MLAEQDALAIYKTLGEHGGRWLTEQLGYFTNNGDTIGIRRLHLIAKAYRRLIGTA